MDSKNELKPMPLWESIALFGVPTVVFLIVTRILIPYINVLIHPALAWFIMGGLLVFAPIFVLAIILFRRDGYETNFRMFLERFRLIKPGKEDWTWVLCSIVAIFILTGLVLLLSRLLAAYSGFWELKTSPSFMHFDPLKGSELFILLAWLPFFFFNIIGEEILWRGYILPRQELTHGNLAWLLNSVLWLIFHVCFGINLMILLLPILFILPYAVQKRKNTWVGIVIHAVINGPTFILVALGLLK